MQRESEQRPHKISYKLRWGRAARACVALRAAALLRALCAVAALWP